MVFPLVSHPLADGTRGQLDGLDVHRRSFSSATRH